MTRNPISTEADEARDAEIARLEAEGYTVLDIYNPRNRLSEHLAPKVALLKGIFGIDDSGRLTRPPPPKAFSQQVFEYIMGGRLREPPAKLATPDLSRRQHQPRRANIRKLIAQAEKAGKPVTSVTTPDGTKLDFGKPESAAAENPWPLDDFKVTKQ
jgi:hypothetical protein